MKIARYSDSNQLHRKWWVLLAVGVGTFMSALDGSVVNTVLPIISHAFGSSVATIEWVVVIYLLVVSGLLLTFGRLGDLHGHKLIYCLGFLLFLTGSASCGLSYRVSMLVFFRAIQALGAAMLFANSPAILTLNFPVEQRGRALGLQATMTYLGLTLGPSLGGWLTEKLSWRAVFYMNLPVGLSALALSLRFIPRDTPLAQRKLFDFAGASLFMGGLVAVLLGLNKGHAWGWTSLPIVGLVLMAILLLLFFLLIENRIQNPILDLTLFRHRLFSTAAASAILNYICVYSIVFLMPFYLLRGRGLTPGQAGLLLTTQPLIMAIVAPLSGMMSDRIGSRLPTTLGMGILAIGLFSLSRLSPVSPLVRVAMALLLTGLGTGIFVSPNSSALLGASPNDQRGVAAGILATARLVGMVLGVGLAGAIFTTVLAQEKPLASGLALFDGVRAGFMAACGVAILGALVSAARETRV